MSGPHSRPPDSAGLGRSPGICISNEVPGDANTETGPGPPPPTHCRTALEEEGEVFQAMSGREEAAGSVWHSG